MVDITRLEQASLDWWDDSADELNLQDYATVEQSNVPPQEFGPLHFTSMLVPTIFYGAPVAAATRKPLPDQIPSTYDSAYPPSVDSYLKLRAAKISSDAEKGWKAFTPPIKRQAGVTVTVNEVKIAAGTTLKWDGDDLYFPSDVTLEFYQHIVPGDVLPSVRVKGTLSAISPRTLKPVLNHTTSYKNWNSAQKSDAIVSQGKGWHNVSYQTKSNGALTSAVERLYHLKDTPSQYMYAWLSTNHEAGFAAGLPPKVMPWRTAGYANFEQQGTDVSFDFMAEVQPSSESSSGMLRDIESTGGGSARKGHVNFFLRAIAYAYDPEKNKIEEKD